MRARLGALAALFVAAALVACSGTAKPRPGQVDPSDAIVHVTCAVTDASIRVNGRDIGSVARLASGGFALSPGTHRLEVRHDDYHSFYRILELTVKQRLRLKVELAARLP